MTEKSEELPDEMAINAWARLHRISNIALERVEDRLKKSGLPPLAWYDVLLELRWAKGQGLRLIEIEKRTLLAQYNASRLVDRIVAAGHAEKRKAQEDGRGVLVYLTSSGGRLLDEMWPTYRTAIKEDFADRLTERDIETLFKILAKLLPD
ncbi:MarR family winged helix-turn-helix transcriptional regulator [uncultured Roseibium sp.]|nr:MarR family winged helix-turn-helix transcriptional regulator [uncultured Roseibium sp.]